MLHKTRGIFLKSTAYSESSLVVQIYTEKFGTQSYLLQGVRKNKSKIRTSILQPLHLFEMVVYHKEQGGLQRISECKNQPLFNHIPYDVLKSSMSIFICELLYNTLKEHHEEPELFDFIFQAIQVLDLTEKKISNFHLWFLVKFTKYLGFYPQNNLDSHTQYFDLRSAAFVSSIPTHPMFMDVEETKLMNFLLNNSIEVILDMKLSPSLRKSMVSNLLSYYQTHIENFKGLKSHIILEEVLND